MQHKQATNVPQTRANCVWYACRVRLAVARLHVRFIRDCLLTCSWPVLYMYTPIMASVNCILLSDLLYSDV